VRKETEAVMEPALPRHGSNAVSARYLRFDSKSVHKIGQTGIDATHVMRRMITGAHILFYSQDPEADLAFFRNFHSVDVRHRWLIFALPPAEAAIHPTDTDFSQTHAGQRLFGTVLYLMCDDLRAQIATLQRKVCAARKSRERLGESAPAFLYLAVVPLACINLVTRRR